MCRFFFKRRGLMCFWFFYILCSCMIFFISDESFSHPQHNVYSPDRSTVQTLQAGMVQRGADKATSSGNHLAKANPKSRLFKAPHQAQPLQNEPKETTAPKESNTERGGHPPLIHTRAHSRPGFRGHVMRMSQKSKSVNDEGKKMVNVYVENGRRDDDQESRKVSEKGWVPPLHAGEHGRPVVLNQSLLSKEQLERFSEGNRLHHFNQFVSDHISLHRSVPAVKDHKCREMQYRPDLPSTSVVIIFHNEAWSTLLRTVHSVLDRSPPQVLQHVILVDDFSDLDHLKEPLEDYLSQPELSKVTLLRSPSREGLIKARLLGLAHVNTSVVVFLDSHCECFEGWLEPLLDRIALNPTTVVVPVIDVINSLTFAIGIQYAKETNVGTFSWALLFQWMPIQPSERRRRIFDIEPIRSPTMAGGLFAIDRAFFYKLGTYDPGFKIWGGENLELSFKIWMCGGTLETIPCSHVGHVFRDISPHTSGGYRNYLTANLGRLAAVWLDDYIVYTNRAMRVREKDRAQLIGDVSERLALRRSLQCHSFGWFMKHVMPEVYLPADAIAHGQIENKKTGLCITFDDDDDGFVELETCSSRRIRSEMKWNINQGESMIFQDGYQLSRSRLCLDYSANKNRSLQCLRCHGMGGNQLWEYFEERKQLYHVISRTCAEASPGESPQRVVMAACHPANPLQQWHWDTSPLPGPSWRKDEAAGKPVL